MSLELITDNECLIMFSTSFGRILGKEFVISKETSLLLSDKGMSLIFTMNSGFFMEKLI